MHKLTYDKNTSTIMNLYSGVQNRVLLKNEKTPTLHTGVQNRVLLKNEKTPALHTGVVIIFKLIMIILFIF